MIRTWALVAALAIAPGAALAQEQDQQGGLGLDLSDDAQKKAQEEQDQKAKEEQEQKAKEDAERARAAAQTSDTSTAAAPAAPAPASDTLEHDITQDDRVKSVQRKVYLKKGRFELAPFFTVSLNDPFYTKVGGSVRGAYFLADTLAVAARFTYVQVYKSDDARLATRDFHSRLRFSEPIWSGMGDLEWSPLYGKIAIFNSILHFDAYLVGGLGVMFTRASLDQVQPDPTKSDTQARGPSTAADIGGGLRFVVKDWLAVNVAVINTSFVDRPEGTTKSSTQNVLTLNAGISIFYPFKSTGREAE